MKIIWKRSIFVATVVVLVAVVVWFFLPDKLIIPVKSATRADWNPKSFWQGSWGKSGVHKGIDIFAKEGTPVIAACSGFVIAAETNGDGGNVVSILGPRWLVHYYAHMKTLSVHAGTFVHQGAEIGAVGTTGNAVGKPPHLHYAIITQIPYVWRYRAEKYGADRMFFLNPHEMLIR